MDEFIDNHDSRNLAFHEMAHAVHFENQIRNEEYDFLDSDMLAHWDKLAALEIENIRNNPNHFFRQYAGTNEYEFFAVTIEYFFENGKLGTVPKSVSGVRVFHCSLHRLFRLKLSSNLKVLIG